MKITDFAIIFMCIFICFSVISGIKNDIIVEEKKRYTTVNNTLDCAIRDALETSVSGIDSDEKTIINKERLRKNLIEQLSFVFYGNCSDIYNSEIEDKIKLLVVCSSDGFMVYRNGWKSFQNYIDKSQEIKVQQLIEYVNNELKDEKFKIELPLSKGEVLRQSIGEYSAYVLYEEKNRKICEFTKANIVFSGAKIKII